jgi:hypothetical protein
MGFGKQADQNVLSGRSSTGYDFTMLIDGQPR